MRKICTFIVVSLVVLAAALAADGPGPDNAKDQPPGANDERRGDSWTKKLDDRAKRGTLHDALQYVRGDSGKWNDGPIWQHLPPLQRKPANVSLDDWADRLLDEEFRPTGNDDNWLLLRTRQLNDNDRVWVERIERRGNRFTIVVNEAVWQGRYGKNFTGYHVAGVNLGKLEPGKYEAKLRIQPLVFDRFEGPGTPRDNWPRDERRAEQAAQELPVEFTVVASPTVRRQ